VGIHMAVRALLVGQSREAQLAHGDVGLSGDPGSVTLDAGHLDMATRENELRPVVIESIDGLPALQ
jgi:hypothetical protein